MFVSGVTVCKLSGEGVVSWTSEVLAVSVLLGGGGSTCPPAGGRGVCVWVSGGTWS